MKTRQWLILAAALAGTACTPVWTVTQGDQVAACPLPVDPTRDALDHYDRGIYFYEIHDYANALLQFGQVICMNPESPAGWGFRGIVHSDLGELDQALADLDRAVMLAPADVSALYYRGLVHWRMANLERATADLDTVLWLDPQLVEALNLRGLVRADLGDVEGALGDYARAISLDPSYVEPYRNRGFLHETLRRFDLAIEDYGHAIRLDPHTPEHYVRRGMAHDENGQHEAAAADFTEALRLAPDSRAAYYGRAWARYLGRGDLAAALADAERSIALQADDFAWDIHGHILVALGRPDEARSSFERAIDLGGEGRITMYKAALRRHSLWTGPVDGRDSPALRQALQACIESRCRLPE